MRYRVSLSGHARCFRWSHSMECGIIRMPLLSYCLVAFKLNSASGTERRRRSDDSRQGRESEGMPMDARLVSPEVCLLHIHKCVCVCLSVCPFPHCLCLPVSYWCVCVCVYILSFFPSSPILDLPKRVCLCFYICFLSFATMIQMWWSLIVCVCVFM